MKKGITTVVLILLVMFSYGQINNYHILTEEMMKPFQINQTIKIDSSKHHLLTQEMLEPFQSIKEYQSILFLKNNEMKEIKLHLRSVKLVNYYFENMFYYKPIIYRF